MEQRNKYLLAGSASFILLVIAVTIVSGAFNGAEDSPSNRDIEPENVSYAEPGEDAGKIEESGSAEITVSIDGLGVAPARPRVSLGEPVEFQNDNSYSVRLEFDRTNREPVIESGSSVVMSFTAMTSYDVINVEQEERVTGGQINAQ